MSREDELKLLDPRLQAGQELLNQLEDERKTSSLNVELLKLLKRTEEATNITREAELRALSDTDAAIQRRIYLLQDEANVVDSIKKVDSARNSVATAYASFVATVKSSGEALVSASENITKGYLAAKDKAEKAKQNADSIALEEADRIAKASIESSKRLKEFANNIRKFVKELTFASLNLRDQLGYLQASFNETVAKAKTGDEESLDNITDIAGKLID